MELKRRDDVAGATSLLSPETAARRREEELELKAADLLVKSLEDGEVAIQEEDDIVFQLKVCKLTLGSIC